MVKYNLNSSDNARLDAVFGALSDSTRRAILARLTQGPVRVTDLAAPFAMSLPAVSKHVKVLERAGLLARDRDGRVHRCRLEGAGLAGAADWLEQTRAFWEGNLDSLARYLDANQSDETELKTPTIPKKR